MKRITFLTFAFLSLFATSTLYAQTLVAHFKFDNDLTDETDTYTLNTTNAPSISYVEGHDGTSNGAVTGLGPAHYLETNENLSITGNASRTVTAWIKTDSVQNKLGINRGIVTMGHRAAQKKFVLLLNGDKVRNDIRGGGGSTGVQTIFDDKWHFLAVVFDKDKVINNSTNGISTIYVDGVSVLDINWSTTNGGVTLNTSSKPLLIGNEVFDDPNTKKRGFEGAIDDVRVYGGALSASQIDDLYSDDVLSNNGITTAVKVYPNPVQDYLYIDNDEVAIVDVYDIVGLRLSTNKVRGGGRLSLGNLNKGIYVLTCKDAQNKFIATIKVIKD